ncbi:MAG: thiamine diphosphokinase, partial [Faecalimonas sp.]
MNRQHVVIISGGTVEEKLALDILKKQSSAFLIAVDRGLEFFYKHKIKPDYIVGDFDSIAPEIIAWYKEWT